MSDTLLRVTGLKKYFPHGKPWFFRKQTSWVKAVDGVSFEIKKGQTFGLVGESGCGKSTTGKVLLRVLDPTAGKITFENKEISSIKGRDLVQFRRRVQAVYQDPYASLNPRMRIDRQISEPLVTHGLLKGDALKDKTMELLDKVGLSKAQAKRYPHEFSGGQRQRIGIARALSCDPSFVVLDEPVSALDVSIQAQILNLLSDLQAGMKLTYLFVSHDLSVVEHICDSVAVMYLGKIVEKAGKESLFDNPLHPYTRSLVSAAPVPDPDFKTKAISISGEIPSPLNPPSGCRFHPRCPEKLAICKEIEPKPKEYEKDHFVRCHLY